MSILRIEHSVADFEAWKQAFDSDPIDRRGSGVRRHRILRSTDDPNHVMVDLEFDDRSEAEAAQAALTNVWSGATARGLITDQRSRIVDAVETEEYGGS